MSDIKLLPFGFVNEEAFMGGDLDVVNAARVSFASRSEEMGEREIGLIRFLMRGRHGTPYENGGVFKFHVKCPIFVAREWMRHRIGSYNEWSGRYSQLEPEFFVPWEVYTQVGKPGSYTFTALTEQETEYAHIQMKAAYDEAWYRYLGMIEGGVAKELARAVLPVGTYTQFIWTVNARSLMNFLSLRTDETAQAAIREYAGVCEFIFKTRMPVTHEAWCENGRVAP